MKIWQKGGSIELGTARQIMGSYGPLGTWLLCPAGLGRVLWSWSLSADLAAA